MFGSELTRVNQREGVGKGQVLVEKQMVEGRGRLTYTHQTLYPCYNPFVTSRIKIKNRHHLIDLVSVSPINFPSFCSICSYSLSLVPDPHDSLRLMFRSAIRQH